MPQAADFLAGGGELGALMRAHDWQRTPLGMPSGWPESLRSTLSLCLDSAFPIAIYRGPQLALVRRAENARVALQAVEEQRFDVVLSDIEMPGHMDGIELASRLGARLPPRPTVLMSGYAARIDQARSLGVRTRPRPEASSHSEDEHPEHHAEHQHDEEDGEGDEEEHLRQRARG